MKRLLVFFPLVFAFGLAVVSAQEDATVATSEDPELGMYLTDAEGMTLYLFTNDEPGSGTSACNDDCAVNWPPFTAEEPLTLPDDVPGELSLITRDDGTAQVAYNGMPLYFWANDEAPGDTTGHEVGDVWFVVNPSEAVATPVASPQSSPVASAEQTVNVELGDFYIEPAKTTFRVGETYAFVVTNSGAVIHEFVIEPAGSTEEEVLENASDEEAEIEDLGRGQTAELTWTFTEPGQYQFACHLADHFEQGMVIEITVED